jgi:hypothetical protein
MRYYGYIINLIIKAFLFNNDPDAFKLEIENIKKLKLKIRYKRELFIL